jgi:hypothetical protein
VRVRNDASSSDKRIIPAWGHILTAVEYHYLRAFTDLRLIFRLGPYGSIGKMRDHHGLPFESAPVRAWPNPAREKSVAKSAEPEGPELAAAPMASC